MNYRKAINITIKNCLVYMFGGLVLSSIILNYFFNVDNNIVYKSLVSSRFTEGHNYLYVKYVIGILISIGLLYLNKIKLLFSFPSSKTPALIYIILIVVALNMLLLTILHLNIFKFEFSPNNEFTLNLFIKYSSLMTVIAINEELFFRGVLLHSISKYSSNLMGILISSLIFSFAHILGGISLIQFIGTFIGGIILSFVTINSNILYAIFAHFFWNLSITILQIRTQSTGGIFFESKYLYFLLDDTKWYGHPIELVTVFILLIIAYVLFKKSNISLSLKSDEN